MDTIQRLRRHRARKKLHKLISRSEKVDLLSTMWVLDRAWSDPEYRPPYGYDFPRELFGGSFPHQLSVYPWEVETLVTEILRINPNPGRRLGQPRSWAYVSQVVNNLRVIEDAEYALGTPSFIECEMSRTAHRQFRWQSSNWQGAELTRWWSIFSEPNLAQAIERALGTSLKKFITIALRWNGAFNKQPIQSKLQNNGVSWITDQDIAATVAAISAPIEQLMASSIDNTLASSSTAYRRGVLRERPIISFKRNGEIHYHRPIEMLLKWRLSAGLYYDVISDKSVRDNNWIGFSFEKYIKDLWQAKFPHKMITGDLVYGPKARLRRTPDVLVTCDGLLTHIVECKVAKMQLVVQTSLENSEARTRVVNDIANGVKQVCEFALTVETNASELSLKKSASALLIVVTLDDWIFFGNDMRLEILALARSKLEVEGMGIAVVLVDDVILCTADDLELLFTVQDSNAVDDVMRRSLLPEHKGWPLNAVIASNKTGRLERPRNPLADRLPHFISPHHKAP
jgi:hypothetical protein